MREEAFRAFLAPLISVRSIDSYLSYARRVERTLGIDLDVARIDGEAKLTGIADQLAAHGYPTKSIANALAALRRYVEMRRGLSEDIATQARTARTPLRVDVPRHPLITAAGTGELMRLYGDLIAELRARGISGTANGPVGDYAEHLFATTHGWCLAPNSAAATMRSTIKELATKLRAGVSLTPVLPVN